MVFSLIPFEIKSLETLGSQAAVRSSANWRVGLCW